MAIKVACACGKKLAVKDELAGKKVKCPACQKLLSIPKPKVQAESLDDEWDLGDSAEEDFEDEPSDASVKSRGGKSSASRGAVSRKSSVKGQGKKSKSSNRGLLIGLSAGGGVLVVALLAWLLRPAAPAANVAGDPPANQEQNTAPVRGDAEKQNSTVPPIANVAQEPLTLTGNTGFKCVTFSPDGKRLVSTGSGVNTVSVWDATSGKEILTIKGHTDQVRSVALSFDGQRIASTSDDKTVRIWDAMTGQAIHTLNGHTGVVFGVAFSRDGTRLASGSQDNTVKIWDTTSGQELRTLKGHRGLVHGLAFSQDGTRLASSATHRSIKIWDTANGQELRSLEGHQGLATGLVYCVAFSPDGHSLASASFDQTVKLWDATTGQEKLTLKGHTGAVASVTFSPDGERLASASFDQKLKVWDAINGQELFTLDGHTGSVWSVAFSPDGKRLASAGDNTIRFWDALNPPPKSPASPQNLAANPPNRNASEVTGDLKALQGVWQLVEVETGAATPPSAAQLDQFKATSITITGDTMTIAEPSGKAVSSLKLDSTQKPKTIDLTVLEGPNKGAMPLGIYSLDGDTLRMCLARPGALQRPAELKPDPALAQRVMVLKRAGAAALGAPANGTANVAGGDLKALQGDWHIVDFQQDPPAPPQVLSGLKVVTVTFAGDSMTFDHGSAVPGGRKETVTIKLDASQNPKTIDSTNADGPLKGQTNTGLYSLEGDVLKLHLGASRPPSWTLLKERKSTVMVFNRGRPAAVANAQTLEDKFDHKAWQRVQPTLRPLGIQSQLLTRSEAPESIPEGLQAVAVLVLPDLNASERYPDNVLAAIKSLSHVIVKTVEMNDTKLKQLSEHPGLIGLNLSGKSVITADGLRTLKPCPLFRHLHLEQVSLAPLDLMTMIDELKNLSSLSVNDMPVTDNLLVYLQVQKGLETLSLQNTSVTDAGTAHLAKLTSLKALLLDGSKVTDQGLPELKSLNKLTLLSLRRLNVSPQGVDELKKALPGCNILK